MTHGFEIVLTALTVWGESKGEPYQGKLGVAFVICNRSRLWNQSVSRVVLRAWQFSFWNTGDPSRDDISDIDVHGSVWKDCMKAASAAYYELSLDPTHRAVYYLNPDVVDPLPVWWDVDGDPSSEVRIGHHLFRRQKS